MQSKNTLLTILFTSSILTITWGKELNYKFINRYFLSSQQHQNNRFNNLNYHGKKETINLSMKKTKRDSSINLRFSTFLCTYNFINIRPKLTVQEHLVLSPAFNSSIYFSYKHLFISAAWAIGKFKQENEYAEPGWLYPYPFAYGLIVQQHGYYKYSSINFGLQILKIKSLEIIPNILFGFVKFSKLEYKNIFLTSSGTIVTNDFLNNRKYDKNGAFGFNIHFNYSLCKRWALNFNTGILVIDRSSIGIPVESYLYNAVTLNNQIGLIFKISGR